MKYLRLEGYSIIVVGFIVFFLRILLFDLLKHTFIMIFAHSVTFVKVA